MGFRFSKSLNLPGGFRLNVGARGVGVSWGVRGFRVGVGPRGARYTASVPGTGASWSGALGGPPPPAASRAVAPPRAAPVDPAAAVAAHEALVAQLVSLHRVAPPPWDWAAVAAAPPPANPAERPRWQWFHDVAEGVRAGNVDACDAVLQHLGPFQRLRELGGSIRVSVQQDWCVEAWLLANRAAVVPAEQPTVTPGGRAGRKKIPAARRAEIYQDHVCSAALRIAREVFALLPIPVVFVHVADVRLDPATGHEDFVPVLSVAFDRETFAALNLDGVDPSSAVEGFDHAMRFKQATGFAEIVPLDPSTLAPAAG
jgi:hypothetical protein